MGAQRHVELRVRRVRARVGHAEDARLAAHGMCMIRACGMACGMESGMEFCMAAYNEEGKG